MVSGFSAEIYWMHNIIKIFHHTKNSIFKAFNDSYDSRVVSWHLNATIKNETYLHFQFTVEILTWYKRGKKFGLNTTNEQH